jgi:hypothetical protein
LPVAALYVVRAALPRFGAAALPSVDAVKGSRLCCAMSFCVLGSVTALPSIGVFGATMRYLADIAGGLMLFATWGAWSLLQDMRRRKWLRRMLAASLAVLATGTVILGLLIGYQGYNGHFQTHNPTLHERVTRRLSLCK